MKRIFIATRGVDCGLNPAHQCFRQTVLETLDIDDSVAMFPPVSRTIEVRGVPRHYV
jgi:hypothetical protein